MRLAIPSYVAFRVPTVLRIPVPSARLWPIVLLVCLAFQPFGSFAALGLYIVALAGLFLTRPLPGRNASNWAVLLGYLALALVLVSAFQPASPGLFVVYATYLTLCMGAYWYISGKIESCSRDELLRIVNLVLLADLALNLPTTLIEIVLMGIGDWVTGLSGILLSESFSQNRTNSIRAAMIGVLALVNYRHQRNGLSAVSAGFNAACLILATSMTTILSAFGALAAAILLRRKSAATLVWGAAVVAFLLVANAVNQHLLKTESLFDFVAELNTKWLPKLDIWRQYFAEILPQHPWMLLVGAGLGGMMNRFAILANFQNYSSFPGKEAISSLLRSDLTKTHLVDYYNLEKGVVGRSIISTPWSGNMSFLMEWGLLGILIGLFLAWPFLRRLWGAGRGYLIGSGRFLLLFSFFNLFFDCYLDYPEIVVPFIAVACIIMALEAPARQGRDVRTAT